MDGVCLTYPFRPSRSWLNAPFFGQQVRRAEVFIGVQFLVILLLFIVAISAGASGGAGTCAPLSIDWPSVTTDGTFKLPQLRYGLADLEPHIDESTMRFHYLKHFNGYRTSLNGATSRTNLTEILLTAMSGDAIVRNNAGGFYNHGLFFLTLNRAGWGSGNPSGQLADAITRDFGSLKQFQAEFESGATGRFGSGWVWLSVSSGGRLVITSTPNQDNPLMMVPPDECADADRAARRARAGWKDHDSDDAASRQAGQTRAAAQAAAGGNRGLEGNGVEPVTRADERSATDVALPILGLDVWEHSYYLKHQNRRGEYVKAWWSVVDWNQVSKYYEDFAAQGRAVEWWT